MDECAVTSERRVFVILIIIVKIANSNVNSHAHVAWIPLVSVFRGLGVVSAIKASK